MKQIITLPTWILYKILKPFLPKEHPWKNSKFSLSNWAENSTELNYNFSVFFWLSGFFLVYMLLLLYKGY